MSKPRVFWFHYNRPASRAAGEPRVSLHYRGKCLVVNNVIVQVPTQGRARTTQPHFVMTGKCNMVVHDTERNLAIIQ